MGPTHRNVVRVALGLALVAASASASGSDHANAAAWYGRALESIPELTPAEKIMLDQYADHPSGPPSAELRQLLGRFQRSMDMVTRGSRRGYSDYGLDYSRGFALELPHLGSSRYLSRVMCVDALVKMHDGHNADAAARVASLYRMGGHIGQDRIVISSLVGQSVWSTADTALQTMLDRGLVGAGEALQILAAADALGTTDPFSYVDATVMEYELVAETIEKEIDADGLFSSEKIDPFIANDPPEPLTMTREEVERDLESLGDYIDDVVEVFVVADREQGPQALAAIGERLVAGEYGQLAGRLAPALDRVFELRMTAEDRLAKRVETLEGLAAGKLDFRSEANAAVWYLRAIELLHREPAEVLAALRRGEPIPPRDPDAGGGRWDEVLSLLRDAAVMPRCDFTFAHDPTSLPALAAPYAVGLRDLQRLVLAEIRGRHAAADGAALMDRLRIAWSMVKHLEADPMISTVIANHATFNDLVSLGAEHATGGVLTEDQRGELSSLARRLNRTDPFGYTAAIVRARADLRLPIYEGEMLAEPVSPERFDELNETIKSFDADLLVYLAAVLDTFRHRDEPRETEPLEPLSDVLDLEALAIARREAGEVLPMLSFEVAGLPQRTIPDIASLQRRHAKARRDLREGLRSMQAPGSE